MHSFFRRWSACAFSVEINMSTTAHLHLVALLHCDVTGHLLRICTGCFSHHGIPTAVPRVIFPSGIPVLGSASAACFGCVLIYVTYRRTVSLTRQLSNFSKLQDEMMISGCFCTLQCLLTLYIAVNNCHTYLWSFVLIEVE